MSVVDFDFCLEQNVTPSKNKNVKVVEMYLVLIKNCMSKANKQSNLCSFSALNCLKTMPLLR